MVVVRLVPLGATASVASRLPTKGAEWRRGWLDAHDVGALRWAATHAPRTDHDDLNAKSGRLLPHDDSSDKKGGGNMPLVGSKAERVLTLTPSCELALDALCGDPVHRSNESTCIRCIDERVLHNSTSHPQGNCTAGDAHAWCRRPLPPPPPPPCPPAWKSHVDTSGLLPITLFGAMGNDTSPDDPAVRAAINASAICGGAVGGSLPFSERFCV